MTEPEVSSLPGGVQDDLAKIGALELRIFVCQHVIVHGAKGAIRPMLHAVIEGVMGIFRFESGGARDAADLDTQELALDERPIGAVKTPRTNTTLGDLQSATPWLWLHCEKCQHGSGGATLESVKFSTQFV